jgi:type VI protein secretion system component VasF
VSGDPSALILNLAFSGSYLSRVGSSSTAPWRPSVHQLGSKRSDEASGKVSQPRDGSAYNKNYTEKAKVVYATRIFILS